MITKEEAIELWRSLGLDDYDNQEIYDEVDDFSFSVTRIYNTEKGTFYVDGILTTGNFDIEDIEFDGLEGENYSIPTK